jgi:hypothetical protein
VYNCRLLSLFGRNLSGVWYTFGAVGGGLNIICDEGGISTSFLVVFCGPNDGAGGMDSFLMCLLYVASPRRNSTLCGFDDVRAGLDRQLKPSNERLISVGGIVIVSEEMSD